MNKQQFIGGLRSSLQESGYYSISRQNRGSYRAASQIRKKHRRLAEDEFKTLVLYAQKGCDDAVELTLIYSTRLVCSIVSEHVKRSESLSGQDSDDLIQSGFIGVTRAITKWDPKKATFITYATYWIRKMVKDTMSEIEDFIVVKSSNHYSLSCKIQYLSILYKSECDYNGTPYNLENFTRWLNANGFTQKIKKGKVTANDINKMLLLTSVDSLDREIARSDEGDGSSSIVELIPDDGAYDPSVELENEFTVSERKQFCQEVLSVLTPRQKEVVVLYYNLQDRDECDKLTFRNVAKMLNESNQKEEKYSITECKDLHTEALQRIKVYVEEKGVTYDNFLLV